MAKYVYEAGEGAPQKVVIVAGPTFGQALKFMLFGAAVGAGAFYYLTKDDAKVLPGAQSASATTKAAVEDFAAHTESTTADVTDRLTKLAGRLKIIGSRAKDLVESAGEAIKPTLDTAVAEGKKAAAEVQTKLKKDVDSAGDKPYLAELDGDLPSEKEDKFVE